MQPFDPITLVFEERKTSGQYKVCHSAGAVVASIKKSWTATTYTVTAADGAPMCSTSRGGLFTTWTTVDPAGQTLLVFKPSGTGGTVTFADGRTARIKGRWFADDWSLQDEVGAVLLAATPMKSAWSLWPRPWAVQSFDIKLTVAEIIAVVESHRLAVEARSSARRRRVALRLTAAGRSG